MYGLPKVGQTFNIYGFKLINGEWHRVLAHEHAIVHRVIKGGTAMHSSDVYKYYRIDRNDHPRLLALISTTRHRVIFIDKAGKFHPYFWNENNSMHHNKFVEVVHKEGETYGQKYFPIFTAQSGGTGISLDPNEEAEPTSLPPQPEPFPKEFYAQSLGRTIRHSDLEIKDSYCELNTAIESLVGKRIAAKLAELKRQDQASLFGETARLAAELSSLKATLKSSFPTLPIK